MMPMLRTVLVMLAGASATTMAQGGTEIHLAPIAEWGISIRVGTPKNITRRLGYDNQPSFTSDGKGIWYTSQREGQTDIYRYVPAMDSSVQVTRTGESEYSATPLPDGSGFSVIRVERDSTQRLWRFKHDGSRPRLVLRDVKPVGYHAWGIAGEIVMFVLGEPPTLQRASLNRRGVDTLVQNPGRSIHRIPGRAAVSFVHKKSAQEWWIRQIDHHTGAISDLVRTIPGSEDYAWTPAGLILMASGATLYSWNSLAPGGGWSEVTTFRDSALQGLKRLAVSPDGKWMAMVSDEK